jgi:hypothetical protein
MNIEESKSAIVLIEFQRTCCAGASSGQRIEIRKKWE